MDKAGSSTGGRGLPKRWEAGQNGRGWMEKAGQGPERESLCGTVAEVELWGRDGPSAEGLHSLQDLFACGANNTTGPGSG